MSTVPAESRETERPTGGRWWRWAVTVGLLAVVAYQVDLSEMGRRLADVGWGFLLLAAGLVLVERWVSTLRWWLLLWAKDLRVGLGELFGLQLAAGFIGSFLPTTFSSDAVRITMLTRRTGALVDCIASSVVDRLLMVGSTLLLAALTSVALVGRLPWVEVAWGVWGITALFFMVVVLAWTRRRWRFSGFVTRVLGRRAGAGARLFATSVREYADHLGLLGVSVGLSVFSLFLRLLVVFSLALSVAAEGSFLEYLLVMPVIWTITMLPISIGGFGLQEGAYAALLGFIGVSATVAVSISLLAHLVTRAAALPGMLVWAARDDVRSAARTAPIEPREPDEASYVREA